MTRRVGRNDPCPCGSGAKYKRCCLGRKMTQPAAVQEPAPPTTADHEMTILVETDNGFMMRRVRSASPLRDDIGHGTAAEVATQDAAAVWGLPDFVCRAPLRKRGSGSRELGDGLIVTGRRGLVIQVKSREAPGKDVGREHRWIEKKIEEALRQGAGSIRSLIDEPAALTNLRGRTVDIDTTAMQWTIVVVIDHPNVPEGITTPSRDGGHPAVALLRRDWEFLFDQLKSTHAVVEYLDRVADEAIELGTEPARYYDLASADAATKPEQFPEALLMPTAHVVSAPLLPFEPVAATEKRAHLLVRAILEDVAISPSPEATEEQRLKVLAELDRLPVAQRAEIGNFLMDGLNNVADVGPEETAWQLRSVRGRGGDVHLAFGAGSRLTEMHKHAFAAWVQLKHHDLQQITDKIDELITVGVLLTPRSDRQRSWDTTMIAVHGDLGLTDEELATYRELWPLPQAAAA